MKSKSLLEIQWDAIRAAPETVLHSHANYPTVESRIEDAATLHGPECRNYCSRRSGATFITGCKIYRDVTAAKEVNAERLRLAERLAAIPHRRENAARIAKLRARISKLEIVAGNVEHRHLESWEMTVAAHHAEHRTHKTSGTGKKTLAAQFRNASAEGRQSRANTKQPLWLKQQLARIEPLPDAPLEFQLDLGHGNGMTTYVSEAPPAPAAPPVENFLERTKRITRRQPRVKKVKRIEGSKAHRQTVAFIACIADLVEYQRRFIHVRLCLPAPRA